MRILILVPALLALSMPPTRAQVTIDLRALDALPLPGSQPRAGAGSATYPTSRPAAPQVRAAVRPTAPPPAATPQAVPPQTASSQPTPASPTEAAASQQVALPIVTPPPAAATEPVAPPAPAMTAAPPPPPPITTSSTTRAAETPAGMRLTFDPAATDLSAASVDAIKRFVGAAPNADTVSYNVLAYAAGKADDASVARRLALSRALAVRSALVAEGIQSSRIYVRALGAQAGGGPPDRVDISLLGANAAP